MITLKTLVRTDPAIASVTSAECHLIARALDLICKLAGNFFFKWLIPNEVRREVFAIRMLSATLGRTPEERRSLSDDILHAMQAGMQKGTT